MLLKERVVTNTLMGDKFQGLYKMVLKGQVASEAKPGQFLHVQVSENSDPLMRRPLSIASIDKNAEEVTIMYRVKGRGTELLTRIQENEYISVLGPLGNSFEIPEDGELLLVAGGIGVFPLFSLIQAVEKKDVKIRLFWGGENKEFLESAGLNYLTENKKVTLEIATVDGNMGSKGLVTDLLEDYLGQVSSQLKEEKNIRIQAAACGPNGMLKAVAGICRNYKVALQVSMEERMACGVGACLGCVCTVRDKDGNFQRKRVCKEGPVLNGEEVVWDGEI